MTWSIPSGISLAFRYQKYFKARWLYTDEVQIDELGYRINNFFKPRLFKQLLRSVMYINHLQMFSRTNYLTKLAATGKASKAVKTMILHFVCQRSVVPHHVRGIAYQWRIQSDTQSRKQYRVTPDVTARSMQALSEHLGRLGHTSDSQTLLEMDPPPTRLGLSLNRNPEYLSLSRAGLVPAG